MRTKVSAMVTALVLVVGNEASAQEAVVGVVKQMHGVERGNKIVMSDGTQFKVPGSVKNQLIATQLLAPQVLAVIPDAQPADKHTRQTTPPQVPLVVVPPASPVPPTGGYVVLNGTSASEGPADATAFVAQRIEVTQLKPGHQVAILGAEPVVTAAAQTTRRTFMLPDGREVTVADTVAQAPAEMTVAVIDPDAPLRPGGWIFITRRGDQGYVLSGVPTTDARPGVAVTGTVERVDGNTVTLTDYPAMKIGRETVVFVTQRGTDATASVKPGSTIVFSSSTASSYPSAAPAGVLASGRVIEIRVLRPDPGQLF